GLLLVNGTIYAGFGSNGCNYGNQGWVLAYDAHTPAGRGVRHFTGQGSVIYLAEWSRTDGGQCREYLCGNGRGRVRCRYGRTGLRFQCAEADADTERIALDRLLHTV